MEVHFHRLILHLPRGVFLKKKLISHPFFKEYHTLLTKKDHYTRTKSSLKFEMMFECLGKNSTLFEQMIHFLEGNIPNHINMHFKECHYPKKTYRYSYRFFFNCAIFQRECRKAGRTFFTEYHILWKISFGIKHRYSRILCKNATPLSQLVFVCFFVSFFRNLFWQMPHISEN
jgi:hypothetical protein